MQEILNIMKKDRITTGIKELDIFLEGGYKNPANIMIKGPSGKEKIAFGIHFLKPKDAYLGYIAADSPPKDLEKIAKNMGMSLDLKEIHVIDCYSYTIGKKKAEVGTYVPGPSALNDLSLAINELLKKADGKRIRLLVNSLSTFALYNPKESILKFLQVVGGRLRNANATVMFLVEEGMHKKELMASLEHMMDDVYSIEQTEGGFIFKHSDFPYYPKFRLTPTGIEFL